MKAATQEEIDAALKHLAETANDPDYIMCCWSFTYCTKCRNKDGHIVHISDCKCPDNPSRLPQKELKEWLKRN